MDPQQLQNALNGFSLFHGVDRAARGALRIETLLKYPEGSSIEVFLKNPDQQINGRFLLSDLGQTTALLMTAQVKPWLSKKRQGLMNDILSTCGVEQNGGALELVVNSLADMPAAVIKLAQCCSRVADLTFTKRTALQTLAREEMEEVLSDLEIPFEQDFEIPCLHRIVKVDFMVTAPTKRTGIFTLSSMVANSAHNTANEIFSKWFDIQQAGRTEDRVTIFDDRYNVYREDDLARLANLSTVIPMSERNTIQQILVA